MTPSERERKVEAVRRVLMDVVADGDAALRDLSEWAADVLDAIEKTESFAGTRLGETEADRVAPASAVKDRADGVDDPVGPDPGTPSERERRIEAAARAFYAPVNPATWIAPTVLARNIAAALDAADEAVPMVSLAAVLDVLDRARAAPVPAWPVPLAGGGGACRVEGNPVMPSERERMAFAFREWIHESPLSKCSMGADECPDWPLAYELADLALGVVSSVSSEQEKNGYDGPGTYRHYKGHQYEVIGLALREDSIDKEGLPRLHTRDPIHGGVTFVIYRPLMAGSLLPARGKGEKFWARERSDFDAQVPGHGPRFVKLKGSDA